jgi:hypothetical protein
LFIAVFLILAAASMAIIRSLTSPDGTGNNVTVTPAPTDETARLKTNPAPTSHQILGGASIKTGSAKVVRNVQPRADGRYRATASTSTKRRKSAVRSRSYAQAASHDRYRVYDGGRRIGADPDLNIRRTLARQHTWLN